jgi:hypothetical protein
MQSDPGERSDPGSDSGREASHEPEANDSVRERNQRLSDEFHEKIRKSFSQYAKTYDWPEDVLISYLMMYAMRQHGDLAERLYRFRKKRKTDILQELGDMGY